MTIVPTISEHTPKVRSVFPNSEIKQLNCPQINRQPIQCKIQKSLFYCLRHKHLRVTRFKFEYNARA